MHTHSLLLMYGGFLHCFSVTEIVILIFSKTLDFNIFENVSSIVTVFFKLDKKRYLC